MNQGTINRAPALTDCGAAAKTRDIPLAVKQLEETANRLYEMASAVRDRVAPVLHSVPPSEAVARDNPFNAPLAGDLHNIWKQFLGTEEILRDLLSRIEL